MGEMPVRLLLVCGTSLAVCLGAEYYPQHVQFQNPSFSPKLNNFAKNYHSFQDSYLSFFDNQSKSTATSSEVDEILNFEDPDLRDQKKDKPIAVVSFKPPKKKPNKESAPPHMVRPRPTTEAPITEPLEVQTSKPFAVTSTEFPVTPEPSTSLNPQPLPDVSQPFETPSMLPQMSTSQNSQTSFVPPLQIPPTTEPTNPQDLMQPESSQPYVTPSGPSQIAMVYETHKPSAPYSAPVATSAPYAPSSALLPPYPPSQSFAPPTSDWEPLVSSAPYAPPVPFLEPSGSSAPYPPPATFLDPPQYFASVPFFKQSGGNAVPLVPSISPANTPLTSAALFTSLGLDDERSSRPRLKYRTSFPGSEGDSSSGIFVGNEPLRFSPLGRFEGDTKSRHHSDAVTSEAGSFNGNPGGQDELPSSKPTFIFTQVQGRNLFEGDTERAAPLRLSAGSYSYVSPENVPVYMLYVIGR